MKTLFKGVLALALLGLGRGALFAESPGGEAPKPETAPSVRRDEPPLRWFKGNLHTHSLWSDGNDFPEMIVDWYRKRDYQFLALSDHNTIGQGVKWLSGVVVSKRSPGRHAIEKYRARFGDSWVETRLVNDDFQIRIKPLNEYRALFEKPGEFLLIRSEEITDHFEKKPIHMNATNLVELIKPRGGNSVVDVMKNNLEAVEAQRRATGRSMIIHLNHPNFVWGVTAEELAMVLQERFFEIYNGHPETNYRGDATHASVSRIWDVVNTLRIAEMNSPPLYGLGTDDSHQYFRTRVNDSSPGRGWIMVEARHLTPEALIRSMEAGRFYASSGVVLRSVSYSKDANALEVEVEPDGDAKYTTRFIGTLEGFDPSRKPVVDAAGNPLPVTQEYSADVGKVLATVVGTRARYELTGRELYVRAVVESSKAPEFPSMADQKAAAWTQPVGWEKWIAPRPDGPRPSNLSNP